MNDKIFLDIQSFFISKYNSFKTTRFDKIANSIHHVREYFSRYLLYPSHGSLDTNFRQATFRSLHAVNVAPTLNQCNAAMQVDQPVQLEDA